MRPLIVHRPRQDYDPSLWFPPWDAHRVALCIAENRTILVPNHGNNSVFRGTDLATQLDGRNFFDTHTQQLLSRLTHAPYGAPDDAPLWPLHNPSRQRTFR